MSSLKIFQIYYAQEQLASMDNAFIPYDNTKTNRGREFEMGVLLDHFQNKGYLTADYTGFVSWKFTEKTKLPGSMFVDFVRSNPGYDVYFINPFPAEIRWKSVWVQGNNYHPGILEFTQGLLNKLGYKLHLMDIANGVDTLAYCNYWVANASFWEEYTKFLRPLYEYISHDLTTEEQMFMDRRADKLIDAHYFPFIFERMFSTFLVVADSPVRYLSMNKQLYDNGSPMF